MHSRHPDACGRARCLSRRVAACRSIRTSRVLRRIGRWCGRLRPGRWLGPLRVAAADSLSERQSTSITRPGSGCPAAVEVGDLPRVSIACAYANSRAFTRACRIRARARASARGSIVDNMRHALAEYLEHYNQKRPHRALNLSPPRPPAIVIDLDGQRRIRRRRSSPG
jgi:Integrase core domain